MKRKEEIKKIIMDNMVIKAISPWDGEARFDRYSVIIHKYDNEDLSFIKDNDPRISNAADRIFQLIDPKEWDQLITYYLLLDVVPVHPEGERKVHPRGGRK